MHYFATGVTSGPASDSGMRTRTAPFRRPSEFPKIPGRSIPAIAVAGLGLAGHDAFKVG